MFSFEGHSQVHSARDANKATIYLCIEGVFAPHGGFSREDIYRAVADLEPGESMSFARITGGAVTVTREPRGGRHVHGRSVAARPR